MTTPKLAQARSEATHTATRRQTETAPRRTRGMKPQASQPIRLPLEDMTLQDVLPPDLLEKLEHAEAAGKDPKELISNALRPSLTGNADESVEAALPSAGIGLIARLLNEAKDAERYDEAISSFHGVLTLIKGNSALDDIHYALSLICEGDRLLNDTLFEFMAIRRRTIGPLLEGEQILPWVPVPPIDIAELVKRRASAAA